MIRFLKFLDRLFKKAAGIPDTIARWKQLIPIDTIIDYVKMAERIAGLDSNAKRAYVATLLTDWAKRCLGFTIPASIANYLIEEALQIWLQRIGATQPPPH